MITFKGELRNLKKAIRYRFLLDFGLSSEGSIKGAKNRPSIKKTQKIYDIYQYDGHFLHWIVCCLFRRKDDFSFQ